MTTHTSPNATLSQQSQSTNQPDPLTVHNLLPWFIAHTSNDSRALLAGGVAGSLAKTFTAPLDRVKILFQGSNPNVMHYKNSWTGPFQAVWYLYQHDGVRSIYKGHAATLLRIFPYAALNFYCFDRYKRIILSWRESTHIQGLSEQAMTSVLAGSAAGATSVFFTYPLDYVHSRIAYQVKISRYKGILQTIQSTIHEGVEAARAEGKSTSSLPLFGIRKLYTGFGATVLGIIPYAGVSFAVYDTVKSWTMKNITDDPPVLMRLAWGAMAGAAAQTASYPLDVVRRRMQLYGLASTLPRYRHTAHALKDILRTEGIRGLYVGLTINYWKVAPAHAISFFCYEACKKHLDVQTKKHN